MIGRGANNLYLGFALGAITIFALIASPNVRGQEKTESAAQEEDLGIFARVLSKDGQPVERAIVALADGKTERVRIDEGRIDNLFQLSKTRTAIDGSFSLVSGTDEWQLFVIHDLGFATVDADSFKPGQELTLSPWATIAGKDLKRVLSKKLGLSAKGAGKCSFSHRTKLNSKGDFEFARVVPGYTYFLDSSPRTVTIGRVSAEAGTRHQILLGLPGRKVVGELKFEGGWPEFGFAKAKIQRPDYPDGFDQWDEARRSQWQEQWNKTDAGMRYQTARCLEYPLKITGENRFEIEALPPGFYEILIYFGTDRDENFWRKSKLRVKKNAAEEKHPQPQDAGVIEFFLPSSDD